MWQDYGQFGPQRQPEIWGASNRCVKCWCFPEKKIYHCLTRLGFEDWCKVYCTCWSNNIHGSLKNDTFGTLGFRLRQELRRFLQKIDPTLTEQVPRGCNKRCSPHIHNKTAWGLGVSVFHIGCMKHLIHEGFLRVYWMTVFEHFGRTVCCAVWSLWVPGSESTPKGFAQIRAWHGTKLGAAGETVL